MTRRDIHQALADGNTVVGYGDEVTAYSNPHQYAFKHPEAWTIKKEKPKMENRQEIYRALGEGKTVTHIKHGDVNSDNPKGHTFREPEKWSIKEEESKMYCRFKIETHLSVTVDPVYYEVGTEDYQEKLDEGWTPMKSTTFEEIE